MDSYHYVIMSASQFTVIEVFFFFVYQVMMMTTIGNYIICYMSINPILVLQMTQQLVVFFPLMTHTAHVYYYMCIIDTIHNFFIHD